MVKPTTWKGHLRFAARNSGVNEGIIDRLFGMSRNDDHGQSGRLHFFPTFFTKEENQKTITSREVLTPLSRDTRTPVQGRGPIEVEVISAGSSGTFHLLYVPRPRGRHWSAEQVAADLEEAAQAVTAMLLEYGFSAKKTAGWGIAKDKLLEGAFYFKRPANKGIAPGGTGLWQSPVEEPYESFFKYMDEKGELRGKYIKDGLPLSKAQYKKLREGDTAKFEAFKDWYKKNGCEWARRCGGKTPVAHAPAVTSHPVDLIRELGDLKDLLNNS